MANYLVSWGTTAWKKGTKADPTMTFSLLLPPTPFARGQLDPQFDLPQGTLLLNFQSPILFVGASQLRQSGSYQREVLVLQQPGLWCLTAPYCILQR